MNPYCPVIVIELLIELHIPLLWYSVNRLINDLVPSTTQEAVGRASELQTTKETASRTEEEAFSSHEEVEEVEKGSGTTGQTRSCQDSLEKHDCPARDGRVYRWNLQWKDLQSG